MNNWLLLAILFIFMGMSFLAGIFFALWITEPKYTQEHRDKEFAKRYGPGRW